MQLPGHSLTATEGVLSLSLHKNQRNLERELKPCHEAAYFWQDVVVNNSFRPGYQKRILYKYIIYNHIVYYKGGHHLAERPRPSRNHDNGYPHSNNLSLL